MLSSGCLRLPTTVEIARAQASRDLRCPAEQTEVTARTDLDHYKRIVDVEGCGKLARYAVLRREELGIREPDPDRADIDTFKVDQGKISGSGVVPGP